MYRNRKKAYGALILPGAHDVQGTQKGQHDGGGKSADGGILKRLHSPDDERGTAQDGVQGKKRQAEGSGKKKLHGTLTELLWYFCSSCMFHAGRRQLQEKFFYK